MKKSILFFLLLVAMVCFPAIFQEKTWFFADNFSLFVPLRIFFSESIRNGDFPWWNPHIFSGTPFWADISNAMLYPVTWLFVLFPPSTALNVSILFHLVLGAVGVAVLSRVLSISVTGQRLAGLIWILSLPVQASANNLVDLQSLSWVPWIIAASVKVRLTDSLRSWMFFSLSVTVGLLAGHPYPIFYAILASIGMIFVARKIGFEQITKLGISGVVIALLSAPILFPFLELAAHSTRIHISAKEASNESLSPSHLFSFFLPNLWSDISEGISWGPDWGKQRGVVPYFTIVGTVALVIYGVKRNIQKSRENKILWWIGIAGLIFSLGGGSFLMQTLWFFPFLHYIRTPEMATVLWLVTGSVLLYPALQGYIPISQRIHRRILVALTVCICVAAILKLSSGQWLPVLWTEVDIRLDNALSQGFHTLSVDQVLAQHVLKQIILAIGFSVSMILVLKKKYVSWLLVTGLLFLDLYIAVKPSLLFAPSSIYTVQQTGFEDAVDSRYRTLSLNGHVGWTGLPTYWDNIVMRPPFSETRYTHEEMKTFRELRARKASLVPNWNVPRSISSPFGYSTMILQSTAAYWESVNNGTGINDVDRPDLQDMRYQEQSVKYITGDTILFERTFMKSLLVNFTFLDETDSTLLFERKDVRPIVRSKGTTDPDIQQRTSSLQFFATKEDSTEYDIAIQWYPGWNCLVNTGWCSIEKTDHGMLVRRSGGDQTVELRFVPRHIHLYFWMSWIGIVLIVFLFRRRTPIFSLSAVHK